MYYHPSSVPSHIVGWLLSGSIGSDNVCKTSDGMLNVSASSATESSSSSLESESSWNWFEECWLSELLLVAPVGVEEREPNGELEDSLWSAVGKEVEGGKEFETNSPQARLEATELVSVLFVSLDSEISWLLNTVSWDSEVCLLFSWSYLFCKQ